jgi:hypothetical protein
MCEGKGSAMGRGRQKAKHTKVARELKYFSPDTDLTKLESELGGNPRLDEDLAKWPEYADTATSADSDADDGAASASEPTSDVDDADKAQSA